MKQCGCDYLSCYCGKPSDYERANEKGFIWLNISENQLVITNLPESALFNKFPVYVGEL